MRLPDGSASDSISGVAKTVFATEPRAGSLSSRTKSAPDDNFPWNTNRQEAR